MLLPSALFHPLKISLITSNNRQYKKFRRIIGMQRVDAFPQTVDLIPCSLHQQLTLLGTQNFITPPVDRFHFRKHSDASRNPFINQPGIDPTYVGLSRKRHENYDHICISQESPYQSKKLFWVYAPNRPKESPYSFPPVQPKLLLAWFVQHDTHQAVAHLVSGGEPIGVQTLHNRPYRCRLRSEAEPQRFGPPTNLAHLGND